MWSRALAVLTTPEAAKTFRCRRLPGHGAGPFDEG